MKFLYAISLVEPKLLVLYRLDTHFVLKSIEKCKIRGNSVLYKVKLPRFLMLPRSEWHRELNFDSLETLPNLYCFGFAINVTNFYHAILTRFPNKNLPCKYSMALAESKCQFDRQLGLA